MSESKEPIWGGLLSAATAANLLILRLVLANVGDLVGGANVVVVRKQHDCSRGFGSQAPILGHRILFLSARVMPIHVGVHMLASVFVYTLRQSPTFSADSNVTLSLWLPAIVAASSDKNTPLR